MDKVKKLFSPQAGDTYHAHQAGVPDGVYHRPSVDESAGTGGSSSERKRVNSRSSEQASSATAVSPYRDSARREYGNSATSPGHQDTKRSTSIASTPTSPTKYIYSAPTNFAAGGPSYQSKSSTTNPTSTTGYDTISSTRKPISTSNYNNASPSYDTMSSNPSNQLPPGAFVDDTPNSARSATGGAAPSMGTTGAPQIGRQDLGESLDSYPVGSTTGSGHDGTTSTLADRSVSGTNTSGRSGADYKGTDNFTPHPHSVDASNKPLAAPEDPDATRTLTPADQIAARVMGAGGGETTSYAAAPGTASTTSGNTAMPSMTTGEPTTSSHNYGRDAGTGAAGATMLSGRTGDGLDPSDSGPASKTVGPHSSNFANVMDPRVKPDPSKMHGSDSAATTGGSAAGEGAFPAGTSTESSHNPAVIGGTSATGRHPDAAPYSTERHVERDLYESEQTKGGPLGVVHKHQESKYADKDEPNTTARDKYYGDDGATHGRDYGTAGHGGQAIGGGAGHRSSHDAGTSSHDYSTGKSGTKDSSQASPEESGRASMDSEGRPKKRGLMDRILHREDPNKLHKEPKS